MTVNLVLGFLWLGGATYHLIRNDDDVAFWGCLIMANILFTKGV